jgi:pimeloyl-ACP methyl ester carboxylesterase
MDPKELRFSRLRTNGIRLHLAQAGPADGPLLFLLHGFPECWYAWRGQIAAFAAAGYRTVVPDLRGYGASDKPAHRDEYALDVVANDILEAADALRAASFRVIGHDWGASLGWWLATHHAKRVERLVALNAPHPSIWHEAMTRDPAQRRRSAYVRFFRLPWLPERVLAARDFHALRQGFRDAARKDAFTPEDLAIYRIAWSQPGALRGMLNWYRALMDQPPPASSAVRVAASTLLIWGKRDRYAGPALAEASLRLCERGRIAWLESATHWVQHDEPEEVSRICLDFIRP